MAQGKALSDVTGAIAELEKAVSLTPRYARYFTELDELYEQAGTPIEGRYALFERNRDVVAKRDDSQNRFIALNIAVGRYDDAIRMMSDRKFAVAEVSNLNLAEHWTDAHVLRGRQCLAGAQYEQALADFEAAAVIPPNLPAPETGRAADTPETAYWIGAAHDAIGNHEKAVQSWTRGASLPQTELRRGDCGDKSEFGHRAAQQSYYLGVCFRALGWNDKAHSVFSNLLELGQETLRESSDRFSRQSETRPQRSPRARLADAHYLIALGYLGLGDETKARLEFAQAVEASPDLLGARTALADFGR